MIDSYVQHCVSFCKKVEVYLLRLCQLRQSAGRADFCTNSHSCSGHSSPQSVPALHTLIMAGTNDYSKLFAFRELPNVHSDATLFACSSLN